MSGRCGNKHGARGPSTSLMGTKVVATEMERIRQSEVTYKAKIRALEVEVSTLKGRLDGLRKAKNTTIIRREREEVRISSPNLGRLQPSGTASRLLTQQSREAKPHPSPHPPSQQRDMLKELNSQVDKLNAQLLSDRASYEQLQEETVADHKSEVALLKRRHSEEIQKLTTKRDKDENWSKELQALQFEVERLRAENSDLCTENSDLSRRLEEVLTSNEALRRGSLLLQEKSQALLEELSIKEAEWSQREDRLKEEIRKQWGERYHEWIMKAEKKMEELQQINALLQGMLKTKQDNNL